ncbi:MAG: AI-2E family transporter, partial [Bacteroidota bacterium]
MNISFQKSFFALGLAILIFAVLILAKTVLIPLGLALLLSFILFPLHKKLLKWRLGNIPGALLSILSLALVIMGALTFFSAEILSLSDQVSEFGDKLMKLYVDLITYINQNISFINDLDEQELLNNLRERLKSSAGGLLGETFSSSTSFLTGLFTTIIYTFLLLIYRNGLVSAFMKFAPEAKEEQFFNMLKNIQQVGQKYLSGMLMLIVILGLANSIGLWIIGIDSPFLFGFFAATLSLIPYIGTTLGATIPVLYAFMSQDELW